jgi:HSP20 family protein
MTTTVTKWTPLFPELGLFDRPFRRMLNGFVPGMLPAADVYETPTELVVELEVPGFEEKQLGIEVSDHTLTISGERKLINEETDKSFIIQERLENTFTRRFVLPPEADTEHVKAVFTKGVLEVHAPKLAALTPHKVAITTTS